MSCTWKHFAQSIFANRFKIAYFVFEGKSFKVDFIGTKQLTFSRTFNKKKTKQDKTFNFFIRDKKELAHERINSKAACVID